MMRSRYGLIVLCMMLSQATFASAEVSIGFSTPGLSIGINLPVYPELVRVPGYPVYYAPRMDANYFFYDGMYWVYQNDNWYASSWYNGPWGVVQPELVPLFVLRVPVRYYRQPPVYFRGWASNAPPRWGKHWGHKWEQRRRGWDRWDRASAPRPAPLPVYQRQYTGDRYPGHVEQQHELRTKHYRHQPRDPVVRQHLKQEKVRVFAPARQRGNDGPPAGSSRQSDVQPSRPSRQAEPAARESQPRNQAAPEQRGPTVQEQRQHQEEQRQHQDGARREKGPKSEDHDDKGKGEKHDGERGR